MPPRVSPSFRASSTSCTMRADVAASKQRSGSASSAPTSSGPGSAASSGTRTGPIESVWLTSRMPSSARNPRAIAPRATRAAVSRALARSRMGRASSNPYFCMPTRSACPGRGRVSAAPRPRDISVRSTGSGFITSTHFGHSVLPIRSAIGLPRLRPWRDAPRDREFVLLELHARAAAVAELAAGEIGLDGVARHGDARGQALHDRDEFGAVRFAGSEHTEHSSSLPRPPGASPRARRLRHRATCRDPP